MTTLANFYDFVHAVGTVLLAFFVYIYSPYLLPRTAIPHVAAAFREALQEIKRAEEMGAIQFPSLARRTLEKYESFRLLILLR
jgi:hypothetical protein